jgi:hypothetical protein
MVNQRQEIWRNGISAFSGVSGYLCAAALRSAVGRGDTVAIENSNENSHGGNAVY